MKTERLYVHHVGGRADSSPPPFPTVVSFAESVYNVVYDADASCIAEIEEQQTASRRSILPYCLADSRRESTFHLNVCPFTSSLLPFNDTFGHFYEEKPVSQSDYLFGHVFKPLRTFPLVTESIDQLFADQRIPQVDFLSVDAQGAELLIFEGGRRMLAETTVAVASEISFAQLYQGAPVFGDVDAFLRDKGFLLVRLSPMEFGYKRIPRPFRGRGVPLQGETLYFMTPGRIANGDPAVRQMRLEKLAFCALAFAYTEIAFDAIERSLGIDVLESGPLQVFLRRFHAEVARNPALPRLWHELPSAPEARPARGAWPFRMLKRLVADPRNFVADVGRVRRRRFVKAAMALRRPQLAFNEFERFLSDAGFDLAAREVCLRRLR